ncbi:Tc toxin subunit A [Pantoea sp. App145]|uniref:Tc toxin subunit A-related protein n=1 Tax=Pantoea sp. App145 TaxID=3071567 RepID=UPI003A80BFB4
MTTITKEYASFPYDVATGNALTALSFHSIYDILAVDEERFRCDYDNALDGCAAAIYSQAKTFAPLAKKYASSNAGHASDNLPATATSPLAFFSQAPLVGASGAEARIARYQVPLWDVLFGRDVTRYAEPGSIQSLDSPVSYLLYLVNRLKRMKDGSATAMDRLFSRRPDLKTMLLSNVAMNQVIPASELAGEIVMDATAPLVAKSDGSRESLFTALAAAHYPLTLPFNAAAVRTRLALDALSLSQGEMFEQLAEGYRRDVPKHAAALALSGIDPQLAKMLTEALPAELAPVTLSFKVNADKAILSELDDLIDMSSFWPGQLWTDYPSIIPSALTLTSASGGTISNAQLKPVMDKDARTVSFQLSVDAGSVAADVYRGKTTLTCTFNGVAHLLDVSVVLTGHGATTAAMQNAFKVESTAIANSFGTDIAALTEAQMQVPAEMLSQAAGISTADLIALLSGGEGDVGSAMSPGSKLTGRSCGAAYVWGSAAGVNDALPGQVREGMVSVTPYVLLRLQKFIRLLNHTNLPAADLDLVLQSALQAEKQGDITQGTLRALGVYLRYRDVYEMTAAEFASFLSTIPAASHSGEVSLWQQRFATGQITVTDKELTSEQKALIAAAGAITVADIDALIARSQDKKASAANIAALLRPAILAPRLGLKVGVLMGLIDVITGNVSDTRLSSPTVKADEKDRDTLDLLLLLDEVQQWLAQSKWTAEEVVAQAAKDMSQDEQKSAADLFKGKTVADKDVPPLAAPFLVHAFSLPPAVATTIATFHAKSFSALSGKADTSLRGVLLSINIINRYNLNQQAIQPWNSGAIGTDEHLTFWDQLLTMSDYAWLAASDDPATPAIITTLYAATWKGRLATIYAAEMAAVNEILTVENYSSNQHALLARRVAWAAKTGWSLTDINHIIKMGPTLTDADAQALSLRVGPTDATARQTISDRYCEARNQAVLTYYQALCRQHFIDTEGLRGEQAFNEHLPDATDVAGQLLSDIKMSAKVTTSRVTEAIAAVQAFIQRIVEGLEAGLQFNAGELLRWQETDAKYAIWAANVQLHWHPDQYIIPAARLNKTPAFRVFENSLSQSRLDEEQIETALTGYLSELEQTVNLDIVGGFQDGMDADTSPLYFLGRTKKAPYDYWYRRWGNNDAGVRVWSAWQKITLPMQQNVMLKAPWKPAGWDTAWCTTLNKEAPDVKDFLPVQARLVMLNSRLYFIWASIRAVTETVSTNPAGNDPLPIDKKQQATPYDANSYTAPVKKYYHVISAVHRKLDGGWSEPVDIYQDYAVEESKIDPAAHLNAFVIPEGAAKFDGMVSNVQIPAGDLLMVSLLRLPLAVEPELDKVTTYLLFDAFLNDVSSRDDKTPWLKNSAASPESGVNYKETKDKLLHDYIARLNKDSYLWLKQAQPNMPDQICGNELYVSTRVMTPCVPYSWLFTERHMISRGEAVFGNAVGLTLQVESAGQIGMSSYGVRSVVTLTDKQLGAIPSGFKLVHFLIYQGVSRYSRVQSTSDALVVFGVYNGQLTSKGDVRHGLILVSVDASNVVDFDGSKDALVESGELSVSNAEVQQDAAEIRENIRGVQFLVTRHPNSIDAGSNTNRTIHGNGDPLIGQKVIAIPGVSFMLLVGNTDAIGAKLNELENWSDDAFTSDNDGRRAIWTWDLQPKDVATLQLITRIDKPTKLNVGYLANSANVSFWQGTSRLAGASSVDKDKPLFIATQIVVSDEDKAATSSFTKTLLQPNADMVGFSEMTFRFRVGEGTAKNPTLRKGINLRILGKDQLINQGADLMTAADWGWLKPNFYAEDNQLVLDRKYQLLSTEPQYFVMKIAVPAEAERNIRVDINNKRVFALSLALKTSVKVEDIKVYAMGTDITKPATLVVLNSAGAGFSLSNGTVMLDAPDEASLKTYIASYSYFFIAIPWAVSSMTEIARTGLQFIYDPLMKGETPFIGKIGIDVPALSRLIIQSSCFPERINVGDIATIRIEINPNGEALDKDKNSKLVIQLDKSFQLEENGIIASAKLQRDPVLGILIFTELPAGPLSFVIPVRALNVANPNLPLATIQMKSQGSSMQAVLKQPVVDNGLLEACLDLRYGADVKTLAQTGSWQSITLNELKSPYLLAAITVTAGSSAQDLIASLLLPAGIVIEKDPTKLNALTAALTLPGETLLKSPVDMDGKSDTSVDFPCQLPMGNTVILLIPLKVTASDQAFIGQLRASLRTLQNPQPIWTEQAAAFIQTVNKGALSISSIWESEGLTIQVGDTLTLQLMVKATDDSKGNAVTLQLGQGYSWQSGSPVEVRAKGNVTHVVPTYDAAKATLTLSAAALNVDLNKDESMTLRFQILAKADVARTESNNVTHFVVTNSKGETAQTHDLPLPTPQLQGCHITARLYNQGSDTPLDENTVLIKGTTYDCRISVSMRAEDIARQTRAPSVALATGALATVIRLQVTPDKTIFQAFTPSVEIKYQGIQPLSDADKDKLGSSDSVKNTLGGILKVSLAAFEGQDFSGTMTVPVTVSGQIGASVNGITVMAILPELTAPTARSWLTNINGPSAVIKLTSWDPGNAPFQNLHFTHGGDNTFSDPINLPTTPLLDDDDAKKVSTLPRLVRLNSHFAAELVRTAGRDVRVLFKPTTQDYPLPPMEANGKPDAVEQDVANLVYFWELFFHVPLLVSQRLNEEGRFDEAQSWLKHLFEPFPPRENGQLPSPWKCRLLTSRFSYVSVDTLDGVADPDLIASVQPIYYQRAVFFAYVKNILDQGDSQFRALTRDGFNSAHQSYLLAARLLGAEDDDSVPQVWVPEAVEEAVPDYVKALMQLDDTRFFIPRSNLHNRLFKQLQQRLFNLRNGLTLDGKPLSLPLYDSPLDPTQLHVSRGLQQDKGTELKAGQFTTFRYNVLYPRASAAVDVLIQFGNQLLAATERQEEMGYQTLLCKQQKLMAKFVFDSQKDALSLNQAARVGLEAALNGAKARQNTLQAWIDTDITSAENNALAQRSLVRQLNISGSSLLATGAALDVIPNIFGLADGGARPAAIPNAVGMSIQTAAESQMSDALTTEIRASYARRIEEWQMQKLAVDAEVTQLEAQLRADTLQAQIYQRQLDQTVEQIQQFDDQLQFMQTRFTRAALYQWLSAQVSSLYYQAYDVATSLCLMAQTAWQYETGAYDKTPDFFTGVSWMSYQKGLTSGEQLRLGLMKMEQAYLTRSERSLELRHTFSVKGALGAAWDTTLQGRDKEINHMFAIPFIVSEKALAQRYPNLYQRQVVAVTVTLPCVVGPLEDICAILVQKSGFFTTSADDNATAALALINSPDFKGLEGKESVMSLKGGSSQIALSTGLDDAGAFVMNFNDERLLPFEGNGLVGEWELQFPRPTSSEQQRILQSLTDVIVTFHYRARDAGLASKYTATVLSAI